MYITYSGTLHNSCAASTALRTGDSLQYVVLLVTLQNHLHMLDLSFQDPHVLFWAIPLPSKEVVICNGACIHMHLHTFAYICIYATGNRHANKQMSIPNIYKWATYTVTRPNICIYGLYIYILSDIYIVSH